MVGGGIVCYLYVFEEYGLAGSFGMEVLYVFLLFSSGFGAEVILARWLVVRQIDGSCPIF